MADKAARVTEILSSTTAFSTEAIVDNVKFIFHDLGLPKHYFDANTPESIAKHTASLAAAKELAKSSGRKFEIQLQQEEASSAFFAARSTISTDSTGAVVRRGNAQVSPAVALERYLEGAYLGQGEAKLGEGRGVNNINTNSSVISLSAPLLSSPLCDRHWRLQCYRSKGVLADGAHLRLYFLQQPQFPPVVPGSHKLEDVADPRCMASTHPDLLEIYQQVLDQLATPSRMAPAIVVRRIRDVSGGEDRDMGGSEGQEVDGVQLVIGHKKGSTHSYFTGTPDVYRWYGMYAIDKFVEVFANDVIIFTFKLRLLDFSKALQSFTPIPGSFGGVGSALPPMHLEGSHHGISASQLPMGMSPLASSTRHKDRRSVYTSGGADAPSLDDRMRDLQRDAALHFVLPRTSLTPLLNTGMLSAQEVAYSYCAWKFVYHFITRMSTELNTLIAILKGASTALGDKHGDAMALISKLRKNVQSNSYTESQILDVIFNYPDTVAWLYQQFSALHRPTGGSSSPRTALSKDDAAMHLRKSIKADEEALAIFLTFNAFNHAVLKTNFYKSNIVALSFRLNPDFLSSDFPDRPHGIFFVVGAEFRGFHTRFADVARGGIRLIKSASPQAYSNNLAGLFEECYSLASTQQRKNKDIPEGGSKGVILLTLAHQDKASNAFAKYVDGIMDVLLTPNPEIVDHLGAQEILFFGPDENTADLMDFACEHARGRGYPYWKAFTTGKSLHLGGIPHDTYAMTTRGVRAYVMGIQRQLGLDGPALTKLQTGGPDGDLGSNEILLGNEKTIAVVDGSGVLYDPVGIHREELVRLATERKMIKFFDRSKLSPAGFVVLVEDVDVKLPNGVVVPSGVAFRNNFHLNSMVSGDFFVPCGGRPAAVNADNVNAFLYGAAADGSDAQLSKDTSGPRKARFKYIVEGANLFFTNDARLTIEKQGIVLFKDSSANKGGVTSSSLEVMAALALTDEEFKTHMCVLGAGHADGHAHAPDFYKRYVATVQSIIEENASKEFETLWRENAASGAPISQLSDQLSLRITDLSTHIEKSDALWNNLPLRTRILTDAIPRCLAELCGGAAVVLARLPVNYARQLFGSRLASRFLYAYGLRTTEFSFFEYIDSVLSGEAVAMRTEAKEIFSAPSPIISQGAAAMTRA